jgi:L,D-peptidoglycan transpeptidase YkuD (ErfK/YbiS/YcfS/YnhG family)
MQALPGNRRRMGHDKSLGKPPRRPPRKSVYLRNVRVAASPLDRTQGWLTLGHVRLPCALGRSGLAHDKSEGDGATPIGCFRLGSVWYRPDHGKRPRTGLHVRPTRPDDGWCDDPQDRRYNCPVRLPCRASHERMWRDDGLYDCVLDIRWNRGPIRRGRGSAIFLHVARQKPDGRGFLPTEGCVALRPADVRKVLARMGRGTRILVG